MFGITDFSKPIIDFSNFSFSQLGDAVLFGAAIILMGMLTVFAVLCILWLFLILFKFVFHDLKDKRAQKKASLTVNLADNKDEDKSVDDSEIIAVIAAAIAAAESDNSGIKFRVVSFKRT